MDQNNGSKKLISNIIKASEKIVKNSIYGSASYIFEYDYPLIFNRVSKLKKIFNI